MRVGIVGAGIAGLACAGQLAERAIGVSLFDKGNRPGGRLASVAIGEMAWDLGAQYFLAREPSFVAQTAKWQAEGWIQPWLAGPDGAFVGRPAMASLLAEQCSRLDARFGMLVERIERSDAGWHLAGSGFDDGPFSALVIAVPAEQAAPLLALHDLDAAAEAAAVRSTPCWSVIATFAQAVPCQAHAVYDHGPLAIATCSRSKPGRGNVECWTLQASADWSRENLEMPREEVARQLLLHFSDRVGSPLPPPTFTKAHRWRFARPSGREGSFLWNSRLQLGACGDWCTGPTVEKAWQSGDELGRYLAEMFGTIAATPAALTG